ncbi:proteasome complex subunit Rpn13 ubiquitin receptor-domain-containing protein [Cantharellus anzutake]|uniref:proteasome complex subunit Rpn13 ubiquitin receptor-domain-containing protein n=1 Tax=Cantharellus anzutake TaxID=1750568 RepID=UPI001906C6CD|nr:proteasome complex subunit Rpn13 ubiquitin receptor-domain-containing protein [Cantharellus anzutake]KAF8340544.1 proteasome complex subunit Rpn13 ubiquitin receptor-domain-containing protein [Cantharellus anzutake]
MSRTIYGPIRAGRAFRRSETSNFVDSDAAPGEIIITEGEDGLTRFNWINRNTRTNDLELIIFPADASFVVVPQSEGGRTHVLKFSSSDQRYFFWFQDSHTGAFKSYAKNLNGILDDPSYEIDRVGDVTGQDAPSSSDGPAISTDAPSTGPSTGAGGSLPLDRLAELRALVSNLPNTTEGAIPLAPEMSLIDILTPANLTPLFNTASPEVLNSIFPTLPSDMPFPPSEDVLRSVIESPPFQAQVRALDRALQTGLVGNLVVGLGLPEEAGLGIRPFLKAIQDQAKKNQESQGLVETPWRRIDSTQRGSCSPSVEYRRWS